MRNWKAIKVQNLPAPDDARDFIRNGQFDEVELLNDKYKIETLDVLNVVVKEKYFPKLKEDGEVVELNGELYHIALIWN